MTMETDSLQFCLPEYFAPGLFHAFIEQALGIPMSDFSLGSQVHLEDTFSALKEPVCCWVAILTCSVSNRNQSSWLLREWGFVMN